MRTMLNQEARQPTSQDTARHMKGCLSWTEEDHPAEKAYLDSRYSGRYHELGATVRVIATGDIGWIQQRNQPCAGGRYFLHEMPGKVFNGLELESA